MKNLFSKIKIDTLEKKLDDSLSKIIQNSGEKIVKEIDNFSTKSLEDQWKIIQDKIEEGKNHLSSSKESTENNEDDKDTYNKTTPAIGAYLVCDGAMCSCDQGAMPMLKIPIESHKKYYANDKLAATIKDSNLPKPFFVKCNLKSPPGDVSCTYAKSDWVIKKGDGHPTVGGNDVLIDNGEITCPIGGKITIVNHGQQTSVSSKDIEGFSVDAAPAINSLMPVDTILKEGQEQEEMTTPSVKYIEYNGQSSDKKIAIIERASQRLDFKAAISATAKTATKNNPKKLKGDPRLVSWAILKKDESLGNWKIFPSYGDVIPLTFAEEGTYIILAYGKRPTTINNSDLIKFDKKNWDKNCYFELEVVKSNPITHLEINNLKATESQTITKGNTCTIIPKTRLPLTDEERNSLILEIRNGSNDALVYEQKGNAKYMLPTDQETDYQIYTYYEGSIRPNPVKITIIENEIDNISPKMYPTDRFVRHGEEVSFTADLKNKDNIKDEKIHWVVNGEEKSTGKVFLFKFPANKTKDTDYKIEVYYKNLFSSKKSCIRTITAKQNKVNKIIVSNVTPDNCVFVDQSYDIKADTVIPYTKVFDSPIKWKFIFISSNGESSNKNYPAATIYSQSSSVKQMTTSIEFEAEDKIKFIPHKVGFYTITAIFNGIKTDYILTVKNAQVKTWRFASSNGWTMNKLGMNQAFNIELEIEGGGNQELSLSLYIECKGIGTNSKEVPLGRFKTDQSGKIPVVTIDKDHKFWNEAFALIKGSLLGLGTKQVSLVVSGKVNVFEGKHAVKEGLSLYLPLPKGDMIAPTVQLNRSLEYDARFVDADNNKLLKIVQYGEPVKAQIRILKGYGDNNDVLTKKTFLFTLKENQKWGDKTIDEYKKVKKKLNDGEDILEYDIATDKLGKDTHIKDKGNEYNPRLFYFCLEEESTWIDTDILTYPKGLGDLRNDETIIDLEVHDGMNDDAIDNRNEKKIKNTGKEDKYDYFNQLKVASSTLLNKSLEKKAMAIIGEELIPVNSGNCGGKYCITKSNYAKYPNVPKDKIGILIQEINIRLAGFGGNAPTTEFDDRTEAAIKQFQRDYMEVSPTGKICGSLLKAIDEFSEKFDLSSTMWSQLKCSCGKKGQTLGFKTRSGKELCKCEGWGDQSGLYEYRDNKKNNEAYHNYEYPGLHRSLLFGFKGFYFYLSKQSTYTFRHFSSGYRCRFKQYRSTNHQGKAIDMQFNKGSWQIAEDKKKNLKELRAIRDNLLIKYLNVKKEWKNDNGTPAVNHFSVEPIDLIYIKDTKKPRFDYTYSWIHMDVRQYESKYLNDKFFCKNKETLNGKSIIKFAQDLGLTFMCKCQELVSPSEASVGNENGGCRCNVNLTLSDLTYLGASEENAKKYLDSINETLEEYKINTCLRKSHFLAQIFNETGNLSLLTEQESDYDSSKSKFKGRGIIQLTGKRNYKAYEDHVNKDKENSDKVDFTTTVADAQKLATIPHCVKSAGWYWDKCANLNKWADENDFIKIVQTANGGYFGFDNRLKNLRKCFDYFYYNCENDEGKNTDYLFENSEVYKSNKGSFGWGLWHDPNITERIHGCTKDKDKAIAGYQRFIDKVTDDFEEYEWYDIYKISNFEALLKEVKVNGKKEKRVNALDAAKQQLKLLKECED